VRVGVLLPEPVPFTFSVPDGVRPRGHGGEAMAAAYPDHLALMPNVRPQAAMDDAGESRHTPRG
jgi:hypothetical protein